MNSDYLKFQLNRGLDIIFKDKNHQQIKVKQSRISDIDEIGLLTYLTLTYIFRIQKEQLKLYEDIQDQLKSKSLFESIVIHENILNSKKDFNISESMVMLLIQSLAFFLDIKDFNRIGVSNNVDAIIVYDFKELEGQVYKVPIFELNNDNFEEFSELIRTITCTDVIQEEKEEMDMLEHYDDEELQRLLEEQYRIYKEDKKKEENENKITIDEVIASVCMSENSKYNFTNISDLTIWQLNFYFNFLLEKENIEIVKSQFTSGNYNFEKAPDLNWIKKTKIKLTKCKKLLNE